MAAYNSIDGVPCSSNAALLTGVLRQQWGFQGFTVSDLGGISGLVGSHHVAATPAEAAALALRAGLDSDLSGYGPALRDALTQHLVPIEALNQAVARVLRLKFEMGLFENPYVNPKQASWQVRTPAHVQLTRQVAQESVILLKNDRDLLPLAKTLPRIAVIGPNADNIYNQLGDYTAPQPANNVVTVLEGIRQKVPKSTQVTYVPGCAIRDTAYTTIAEAVAARTAQVAVVVLGAPAPAILKPTTRPPVRLPWPALLAG